MQTWTPKSPDQFNQEMGAYGDRLLGIRDPRAQALGGQILTKTLEHPYKEMARRQADEEQTQLLKSLQTTYPAMPADTLTGEEAGLSGAFKGNITDLKKSILMIPDPVERQKAMEQFDSQVMAAAPKSAGLPQSVVAALSRGGSKVAPILARTEAAQTKAAETAKQDVRGFETKEALANINAKLKPEPTVPTVAIQTVDKDGKPITAIVPKVAGDTFPGQPTAAERKAAGEKQNQVVEVTEAIKQVQANPEAFGFKTFLPSWALERMYGEGTGTRAIVGALSSAKIKDLSGAAVSAHEQNRLNKFLPADGDPVEAVITKLKAYKAELDRKGYTLEAPGAPAGGFDPSQFSVEPG
jgi:hypothetical protein